MRTRGVLWIRSAIVAVALPLVVAAVAAQCWLPQLPRHTAHTNHPLATSVGKEFVVNIDHPHLFDNSTPPCPEQFAPAVLPRSAASPAFAPDMVAATAGSPVLLTYLVVPAVRGPPTALVAVPTGQDLLTRFCLSRR